VTSKACQYATNDEKKIVVLRNVNVKETQNGLQKTIGWTKKFGKKGKNGSKLILKMRRDIKN
jgi:TnpA family transposase